MSSMGSDPFEIPVTAGKSRHRHQREPCLAVAAGPPTNSVEMSCAGRAFNGANSFGQQALASAGSPAPAGSADRQRTRFAFRQSQSRALCSGHPCIAPGAHQCRVQRRRSGRVASAVFADLGPSRASSYEATLIPSDTPLDRYLAGNQKRHDVEPAARIRPLQRQGQLHQVPRRLGAIGRDGRLCRRAGTHQRGRGRSGLSQYRRETHR